MGVMDDRMRGWIHSLLHWGGRRFGITRRSVVIQSAIGFVVFPLLNVAASPPKEEAEAVVSGVGYVTLFLVNGFFAALIAARGLKLLQQNEEWGAYTNWREWRWLRFIEIFVLPLVILATISESILGDDWSTVFSLCKSVSSILLLYAITVPELPPRERKTSPVTRASTVKAH